MARFFRFSNAKRNPEDKRPDGGVVGENYPPLHPHCRCSTGADTSDLSWIDEIVNEIYPEDPSSVDEKAQRENDMKGAPIVDSPKNGNTTQENHQQDEKLWEDAQDAPEVRAVLNAANKAKDKRKYLQESEIFQPARDYSSDAYTMMNIIERSNNDDKKIADTIRWVVESKGDDLDPAIKKRFRLENIGDDLSEQVGLVRKAVKALEKTIDKCRMPKMTILARGTSPDYGILGGDDSVINMMHVGQKIKSKGFLSLSYSQEKAANYASADGKRKGLNRIIIYVDIPEGAHGLMMEGLTTAKKEHEVLFNSGETFTVLSIGKGAIGNNKGQYTIVHLRMEKRHEKT